MILGETYERSYNNNYMIIQAKEEVYAGFCEKIIQENEIPGLLPCQFRVLEGTLFFYYEISGKRTLSQLFQKKKIGSQEMRRLLFSLNALQKEAQRYLLDFQKCILLPEYLYSDFDINHLYAIYYPDYEDSAGLEELGNFLIEHTDYQEAEAVELAYSFQRKIMEENASLGQIIKELLKEKSGESFLKPGVYEEKKEPNFSYEKKEPDIIPEVVEEIVKSETLNRDLEEKEEWKIKITSYIQKLQKILKWRGGFLKKEKGSRKERKKEVIYEMEIDMDEDRDEVPFYTKASVSEETQFFSCQDEPEVHRLAYQGRKNLPNLELTVFPYIVGKGTKGIDGCLEMPTISRIHSQLDFIKDAYYITDLNSTNGTFVNGERLMPNSRQRLMPGDQIQFAGEVYIFQ